MKLEIDSWRWSGVPFYLRAGKCLPVTATEVVVDLRAAADPCVRRSRARAAQLSAFPCWARISRSPWARTPRRPGPTMQGREVELFVVSSSRTRMDAYERLISEALIGDTSHFARQDEVEAAWAVVDPVLGLDDPAVRVRRGPGGRRSGRSDRGPCGWHNPGPDAHSWTRSCGALEMTDFAP